MARTAITTVKLTRASADATGTVAAGGTAIDQANGMVFTAKKAHKAVIIWYNSAGAGHVLTVRAGVYPPALSQGQGDFVVASSATTALQTVTLDAARFLQKDGSIQIDWDAGTTGRVWVYEFPA